MQEIPIIRRISTVSSKFLSSQRITFFTIDHILIPITKDFYKRREVAQNMLPRDVPIALYILLSVIYSSQAPESSYLPRYRQQFFEGCPTVVLPFL